MSQRSDVQNMPTPSEDAVRLELLPIEQRSDNTDKTTRQDLADERSLRDNETPSIKGWPQKPVLLRRNWQKRAMLALDMIIAFVPILFVGKVQARQLLEKMDSNLTDC